MTAHRLHGGEALLGALLDVDQPADLDGRLAGVDEVFVRRATHHRVALTILPRLHEAVAVPLPVLNALRTYRQHVVARQMLMMLDLMAVADAFQDIRLRWVLLKGPVTAATLYGGLERRQWNDLDVLVSGQDLEKALQSLERAGAVLVDRNWPMMRRRRQGELNLLLPHGSVLDLHWHLVNQVSRRSRFALDVPEMLARRRVVEVHRGVSAPALDAEDQLVHLALHGCLSGGHLLQWVQDVALAASETDDWGLVVERAARGGVALPVALMLERSRAVLGAAVPLDVLEALAPRWGWRALGRAATQLRPVPDPYRELGSGRLVYMSTLDRLGSSARAAAGRSTGRVAAALGRPGHREEEVRELHLDVPSPADRTAFLAGAARETAAVTERPAQQ